MTREKQSEVLRRLANGEIDIAQADFLIEKLEEQESFSSYDEIPVEEEIPSCADDEADRRQKAKEAAIPPGFKKFRWVWVWFFASGVVITAMGALGIYSGYQAAGMSWGFWLSWIPLLLGLLIVTLSAATVNSLWLHVRVHTGKNEWPRRLFISLPLPMFLLRLGLKLGDLVIDGVGKFGSDDIGRVLAAVRDSDVPLAVHVEEDNGEKVEVFIAKAR